VETFGNILLVGGSAWMLLAAIGVFRFQNAYERLHAATKAATLGLLLILAGAGVQVGGPDAAKLALTGVFIFLTAPVGAHLVGRAVTHWGVEDIDLNTVNELPDDR
jgi:multicomponent Na+:H+ antiporter subunit G